MYKERKKDLPVFSQRVASNLMLMGFKLYNVAKNKKFEGKNVFYFRDCQEVRQAIEKINGNLTDTDM